MDSSPRAILSKFILSGLAAAMLPSCSLPEGSVAGLPDVIDYNWHVRPILSENCFQCHGPDPESLEAQLRLDVGERAKGELPESPGRFAIIPGDPARSVLVERITAGNPDERMPPRSTRKSLTDLQIEILRRWIAEGAEYRKHWAFIPHELPTPPDTAFSDRVLNDVDNFVFRRLEAEGLAPSDEADKETLINRLSLTLTGLPPALDDVDAFVEDSRPEAYAALVDRLLDSPRYAEHMAAYWMDLARWSETDGYLDDHHDRFLWPWRDWVIRAFDSNMPFDEFGKLQLAGDLLPNATAEQILATAFLRVGKRTTENGAIDAEYRAENMVERTDNALGTAFLGLTVGCARCHDHKFDPITQRDYYSLGAFFNSNDEPGVYAPGYSGIQGGPTLPWPDEAAAAEIAAAEARIDRATRAWEAARVDAAPAASTRARQLAGGPADALTAVLETRLNSALDAHYPFEAATPAALVDLPPPRPPHSAPGVGVDLSVIRDVPLDEATPEERRRIEVAQLDARVPRNYVPDALTLSPSATKDVPAAVIQAPIFGPGVGGRALYFDETNKGFLGRDVGWYDRSEPFSIDFWFLAAERYEEVPVVSHRSEQNAGTTGYTVKIRDGKLIFRLANSPPANMIEIEAIDEFPVGKWTHVTLTYDGTSRADGTRIHLNGDRIETKVIRDSLTRSILPWSNGNILEPFIGLTLGTRFREKAPVGAAIDELRFFGKALQPLEVAYLHGGRAALEGGPALVAELGELLIQADRGVEAAYDALVEARGAHNALVSVVPQVLVMKDAPVPVPTHVLQRGLYNAPGDVVHPRGLDVVLEWDESLPENRLGLAEWLFDERNPLTARVFVNRIWQMHFGRGIVETSEDFGSQGAIPTHPALLDWLTAEFVASGWDIKALHRRIVMSATYRQSSRLSNELALRDPGNTLLARGPRWRMTAEMVRDHALAVAGLLRDEVGGPSVTPYQPDGIWHPLITFYSYPDARDLPADAHHRRTLYTFVKRNALHPALKIFDFGNRTESIARRRSSNTPLQALTLMNDPQFVEAYRELAAHVLRSEALDDDRLRLLYRLATQMTPNTEQMELMRDYHAGQRAAHADDAAKPAQLLSTGVTEADPSLDPIELAAMTGVAALVMNSPDAYTVR